MLRQTLGLHILTNVYLVQPTSLSWVKSRASSPDASSVCRILCFTCSHSTSIDSRWYSSAIPKVCQRGTESAGPVRKRRLIPLGGTTEQGPHPPTTFLESDPEKKQIYFKIHHLKILLTTLYNILHISLIWRHFLKLLLNCEKINIRFTI